jgi:hypothetical protein
VPDWPNSVAMNSGSSTNSRSRGSSGTRGVRPGGPWALANMRSGPFQRSQWRRSWRLAVVLRVAVRTGLRVRLGSQAAVAMRVPAVITHEVFALVGDVLGDFGRKSRALKTWKLRRDPPRRSALAAPGEAAAVVLCGAIQHRSVVGQADHARQTERTTQDVLGQSLQTGGVARGQIDAVVDAEAGVGPAAHLVHGLLVDLSTYGSCSSRWSGARRCRTWRVQFLLVKANVLDPVFVLGRTW